mgnify:CR=1 FL=1
MRYGGVRGGGRGREDGGGSASMAESRQTAAKARNEVLMAATRTGAAAKLEGDQ